ncbi:hypothetical protein [Solitalea canadensis]|uniref:Uncharacterized protein n=1 Tax=Solitalea canadensis (strain ATCC 29591 / DSM 3403 / JCM 21819 / LMG 8368 / NBRC 15130 / NCIMB 12057 / USAM 9D) TaxID=929556 RepID=H8KS84_SOLCM|nr:hypothetical protein [Solitalea canadensis]AFD07872.1 hypothetical protein Solca_2847 [Solitalea canadensis DSM 3403]
MKHTLTFFFSFFIVINVFAQDKKVTSAIVDEGKALYRSEMASWYGTDIFFENFKDKTANFGGYFSYDEENITKCVFVSKGEKPTVLATISFDSTFSVENAKVIGKDRALSSREQQYFALRKKAIETLDADTLFKSYSNTSLNLIPLIRNGQKKVFILTGPKVNGVVIFGNDYLISFDENNKVTEKKSLHKNIIPINFKPDEEHNVELSMHSHLPETGDYITSTDICTLMLYGNFAKWKQHLVMSKKYISIWDCSKNELNVITKEAWDKINEHQKKLKSN